LWHSGFGNYVWKRLLTVSAEDCWGILTSEIKALHDSYVLVNKTVPAREARGRIFISKAVILLCAAKKNRDADHLQNFTYDALAEIDADQLAADLLAAGREKVPDYAFDCHTLKGKRKGKTKADFFREEQRALMPFQPGLFDDLPEG
jgi:replication-associated recombination protein RarA